MARPKVNIDWKIVDSLLEADCEGTEIAAYLGLSVNTLYNRCKIDNNINFSGYLQEKKATNINPKSKEQIVKEWKQINIKKNTKNKDLNGFYIYIINQENTNYYKIGISKQIISNRIAALQSGNPFKLNVIWKYYTPNASRIEKELHNKYKSNNVSGEWFELSKNDIEIIKQKIIKESIKLDQYKLFSNE